MGSRNCVQETAQKGVSLGDTSKTAPGGTGTLDQIIQGAGWRKGPTSKTTGG